MINLYEIEQAYRSGEELDGINQLYKDGLAEVTDDEKLQIWIQVAAFANFQMIQHLIAQGWRAMGVEDQYGNTLLHVLAEARFENSYFNDIGKIYESTKLLLANKVSPLKKNSDGLTAMMVGAKSGYFEMLQAYQEAGAKIDWADPEGNTLLHLAAEYSARFLADFENAESNLKANHEQEIDPEDKREVYRRQVFEWKYQIAESRVDDFIKFLLLGMELGIDPYQKNNYGDNAIDTAIKNKSKFAGAFLKGLDVSDPENLQLNLDAGGQDIFQACINRDAEGILALIKLGENPNEEYDKEGSSFNKMLPLSISVVLHDLTSIDLLLKNGADPVLSDSQSWHPLRHLYSASSKVNTSFDQFEKKIFSEILKCFVTAGFDIDSLLDDEENTILSLSAKNADSLQMFNNYSMAKSIIAEAIYSDANVNKTNRDGITPLMYLCLADSSRAENEIIMLLEQGATTDLQDKNGKTALIYASMNPDKSTAKTYCELLEQFGDIRVEVKDNAEKSALDYAVELDNENLVAWLLEKQ